MNVYTATFLKSAQETVKSNRPPVSSLSVFFDEDLNTPSGEPFSERVKARAGEVQDEIMSSYTYPHPATKELITPVSPGYEALFKDKGKGLPFGMSTNAYNYLKDKLSVLDFYKSDPIIKRHLTNIIQRGNVLAP